MNNLLRFALSDLRHRRGLALLNAGVVSVACLYLLVLGGLGVRVYQRQRATIDTGVLTRLVATAPDIAQGSRFTPARLEEIAAWPRVVQAYPCVEIGVRLVLPNGRAVDVVAQGIVSNDPIAAPRRLAAGRGLSAPGAHEILVPRGFFVHGNEEKREKEGGGGTGADADTRMVLEVARSDGGRTRQLRIPVRVAGTLRSSATNRILAPVALVQRLDLWCTRRVDSLSDDGAAARAPRVRAIVYVDAQHVAELPRLARELSISFDRNGAGSIKDIAVPPSRPALRREQARSLPSGSSTPAWAAFPVRWIRFLVRDTRHPRGLVEPSLVTTLRLSRPVCLAAFAEVAVEARSAGGALRVVGTGADDPRRFERGALTAGSWMREDAVVPGVVWPAGREPVSELRFTRGTGRGPGDVLTVPVRIQGRTAMPFAFAPRAFLRGVRRWQRGAALYNETRARFESPREVARARGALRAVVIARSADDVESVGERLRDAGYRTEDRLAEQRSLRKLGHVLAVLVAVFVLGAALNAMVGNGVTASLNIRSRVREIGILRAHGVAPGAIVSVFAIQAALIGCVAFVAAVFVLALGENALAGLLRRVFGDGAPSSVLALDLWWLFAVALAVSVLFSLAGVVFPAVRAARRHPVESLRAQG